MGDPIAWAGLVLAIIALPFVYKRVEIIGRWCRRRFEPLPDEFDGVELLLERVSEEEVRIEHSRRVHMKALSLSTFDRGIVPTPGNARELLPGESLVWRLPPGLRDEPMTVRWVAPPLRRRRLFDSLRPDPVHSERFARFEARENPQACIEARIAWRRLWDPMSGMPLHQEDEFRKLYEKIVRDGGTESA